MSLYAQQDRYPKLPPFHRNLYNAIKTDYYDVSTPSTRVFLRAYAFGCLAEVLPSTVRSAIALSIAHYKSKKGIQSLIQAFLARCDNILRDALGRRGLAIFFGTTLGGAAWLDVRLQTILAKLWLRLRKNDNPSANVTLTSSTRDRIFAVSTFLSTAGTSLVAFGLQRSPRTRRPSSAASNLPLVRVGSSTQNARTRYQSATLDFTLFLLVRAMDTSLRALYKNADLARYRLIRFLANKGDALLFVASAWRVMWVWFYKPWLLPSSYDR